MKVSNNTRKRVLLFVIPASHRQQQRKTRRMAAAPSKTLMDLFQQPPPAKRLKSTTATTTSAIIVNNNNNNNTSGSESDDQKQKQKRRMELNKALAKSKLNLKLCSQKGGGGGGGLGLVGCCIKLEELLVEETWSHVLSGELQKPYANKLSQFLQTEICNAAAAVPIYPPNHLIFNALNTTPFDHLKAVIIGQDPYHGPGQAMGLSFSVPDGIKLPSSLQNIFKELQQDLGCSIPSTGNLQKWALQGVLLLNAVLTVRQHQANSHANKGWEQFTDAVIRAISREKSGVVFLLWGNYAQAKSRLVDESKHHVLKSAHPSGLSANRGFFGCRHFSRTNQILEKLGISAIDWQL